MRGIAVCFGEVLWDMLPEGARVGGAPLNVCSHFRQQGSTSYIISQVGKDKLGDELLQELRKMHIDTTYCLASENYPTSTVNVELDAFGKANYTIVEGVAWDYILYSQEAENVIRQADVFVFGSLAARNPVSYSTLLSYLAVAQYAVMDVNLRSPYYSKEVLFELLSKAHCLKINDEEIFLLADWLGIEDREVDVILGALIVRFAGLSEIILTKGAEGAYYFSNTLKSSVKAYEIHVIDTVGSGDSFLAGFLSKRLEGQGVEEALAFASLLSGFVATQSGANPSYSIEDLHVFRNSHRYR